MEDTLQSNQGIKGLNDLTRVKEKEENAIVGGIGTGKVRVCNNQGFLMRCAMHRSKSRYVLVFLTQLGRSLDM